MAWICSIPNSISYKFFHNSILDSNPWHNSKSSHMNHNSRVHYTFVCKSKQMPSCSSWNKKFTCALRTNSIQFYLIFPKLESANDCLHNFRNFWSIFFFLIRSWLGSLRFISCLYDNFCSCSFLTFDRSSPCCNFFVVLVCPEKLF